jgi:hypothetical protein
VPGGGPSIGLILNSAILEVRFECACPRVGDDAVLRTFFGVLGGGLVNEDNPLVSNA